LNPRSRLHQRRAGAVRGTFVSRRHLSRNSASGSCLWTKLSVSSLFFFLLQLPSCELTVSVEPCMTTK